MLLLRYAHGTRGVLWLVAVLAAAGALRQADAQQGTQSTDRANESTAEAPPTPGQPTTAAQQLSQAERVVGHARELRETLTSRLEGATRRSDIVMVDCLTPLQTQLEATLASAESRLRALRLLAQGGDAAAADHEYTMVMVAGQRVQVVESDMNQCLGDSDITTGDNRVTVEVTVHLPDEDPTAPLAPAPLPPVPFIPPPLSPAL